MQYKLKKMLGLIYGDSLIAIDSVKVGMDLVKEALLAAWCLAAGRVAVSDNGVIDGKSLKGVINSVLDILAVSSAAAPAAQAADADL